MMMVEDVVRMMTDDGTRTLYTPASPVCHCHGRIRPSRDRGERVTALDLGDHKQFQEIQNSLIQIQAKCKQF